MLVLVDLKINPILKKKNWKSTGPCQGKFTLGAEGGAAAVCAHSVAVARVATVTRYHERGEASEATASV